MTGNALLLIFARVCNSVAGLLFLYTCTQLLTNQQFVEINLALTLAYLGSVICDSSLTVQSYMIQGSSANDFLRVQRARVTNYLLTTPVFALLMFGMTTVSWEVMSILTFYYVMQSQNFDWYLYASDEQRNWAIKTIFSSVISGLIVLQAFTYNIPVFLYGYNLSLIVFSVLFLMSIRADLPLTIRVTKDFKQSYDWRLLSFLANGVAYNSPVVLSKILDSQAAAASVLVYRITSSVISVFSPVVEFFVSKIGKNPTSFQLPQVAILGYFFLLCLLFVTFLLPDWMFEVDSFTISIRHAAFGVSIFVLFFYENILTRSGLFLAPKKKSMFQIITLAIALSIGMLLYLFKIDEAPLLLALVIYQLIMIAHHFFLVIFGQERVTK